MRPPGQVEHDPRQRLVHRNQGVAEASYPALVTQGVFQRLAKRESHILHGVMGVNLQVAPGRQRQADTAMTGTCRQHVVEERQPGLDTHLAVAVEVHGHGNVRFTGLALDCRGTAHVLTFAAAQRAGRDPSTGRQHRVSN